MIHANDDTFHQLLNLELDGALSAAEETQLAGFLAQGGDYRAEQLRMARLAGMLAASRVSVRPDFHHEVMAGLPAAAWEIRRQGGWRMAVATAALLLIAALSLVTLAGGGLGAAAPVAGLLAAVGGVMQGSLVVGAGMLGASWTGAGLAVGSLFDGSPATLLAFLAVVVGLDAIFLLLLFGRSRRDDSATVRARSGPGSSR